jgi:hypothetical protein
MMIDNDMKVTRLENSLLSAQNSRYRAEALAASLERQLSRILLIIRHSTHTSSSSSLATSIASTVSLSSAAASDRGAPGIYYTTAPPLYIAHNITYCNISVFIS